LLHVLPEGFQRIRYYGLLANRHREENLALCRELLKMPPPKPKSEVKEDYRDRYEELTGRSLKTCSACHEGEMIVIETLERTTIRPPIANTS
jgi:Putative transposase